MSKLIGTNPNQVPSNADLGTAAFMDKKEFLLSKGSEMSAINAVISKTAVDVFIYDTTKDSDGGAWRKRVQHTSWYNERLNTTTRGSRREFPCVAVIVAEATKVTIYDGDDPSIPMWMVFNNSDDRMLGSIPTAAVVKNGALWVALNGYGVSEINFIKDEAWRHRNNVGSNYYGKWHGGITTRNVAGTFSKSDYIGALVNGLCNDIAVTVLPNAPIDADTGLPVPTIAVATDGGVSVIKDDGSVVDIVSDTLVHETPREVKFVGDKVFWIAGNNYDNAWSSVNSIEIPASDVTIPYFTVTTANDLVSKYTPKEWNVVNHVGDLLIPINVQSPRTDGLIEVTKDNEIIIGGKGTDDHGTIVKVAENVSNPASGMIAQIASDYNTGWQPGDIKLATLSDTDATNVVGTSKFTNDLFTGWTPTGGSSFTVNGNGTVSVGNGDGVADAFLHSPTYTLVIGKTYVIDIQASSTNGTGLGLYLNSAGGPEGYLWDRTKTFVATQTSNTLFIYRFSGHNGTGTLDKVVLREAEPDRSVNNNAIQVFGTVTKTAVATGADLVGYSGFSSSNYLQHTFSTNYGSPAVVSFMGWQKTSDISNYQYMASLIDGTSGNMFGMSINSNSTGASAGKPYFYDNVNSSLEATTRVDDGTWHFMVGVFDGTSKKLYIDGKLNASATVTALAMTNVTETNVGFYSGAITGTKQYFHLGSIALIRISATVPSSKQIKKIYEDEKFLFQENAKATLYGTSDAVTALAYDDDTDLLHVGTSAGRSDFQGLRRINNTTRAIGTAISAVDGFIVEE